MDLETELPLEEVRRLQRCINDLIALLAFPAMWTGRSQSQIVSSFADGLLRILRLDLVYLRHTDDSGAQSECLRVPHGEQSESAAAGELFTALGDDLTKWPAQLTLRPNGACLSIQPLPLGLYAGKGVVVVGSQRADFPLQTEKLLLNVAANQLLLALQEAQRRLEQKRVAEELDRRVAQRTAELAALNAELANVARTTSLGVLTAAIAHEVNQPISGIITNAATSVRMLSAQPPNIEGALETARRTMRDGKRAAEVITRLRTLYTSKDIQPEPMDLNEAAQEVISLSLSELQRNGVVLRHELADNLPPVSGDRIQLQQVILNLLRNASDAMTTIDDRPKELIIRTEPDEADSVRLSVSDVGIGFSPQAADRLFEPFHTTKSDGMGIGLSVSRSIIEAHHGRLWVTPNAGPGLTFAFSLPRQ
jgi:signal transduction histidine kinase